MPGEIHEAPASWIQRELADWRAVGLLDPASWANIKTAASLQFFSNFVGRSKIPDLAIIPTINGTPRDYPSIISETGWSQSQPQLHRTGDLWQLGTRGAANVVLLAKIFAPNV
ncbi:hypothetical protein HOY80DRAFT_877105, partial [Tuber brumale]